MPYGWEDCRSAAAGGNASSSPPASDVTASSTSLPRASLPHGSPGVSLQCEFPGELGDLAHRGKVRRPLDGRGRNGSQRGRLERRFSGRLGRPCVRDLRGRRWGGLGGERAARPAGFADSGQKLLNVLVNRFHVLGNRRRRFRRIGMTGIERRPLRNEIASRILSTGYFWKVGALVRQRIFILACGQAKPTGTG